MQGAVLKSIVVGSLVWVIVCIAGGFVVLARLGEYGSVVQLLIGVVMGLLGAASHVVLSVFSRFRRLNFLQSDFLNRLSAYLPLVAIAALLVNVKIAESDPDFWPEMANLFAREWQIEKTHQHTHPAFVPYALSPFKRSITLPDGKTLQRQFKQGDVIWSNSQTHIGSNNGETPTHVILVETKSNIGACATS